MAKKITYGGYKPPKPIRVLKAKPEPAKNPAGEAHNQMLAIRALKGGVCLALRYHDLRRILEVHTVGITKTGRPAMRAYQVSGDTESHQPIPDWRMMCFDECFDVSMSDRPSSAPRPKYQKRDKAFSAIVAQV